MKKEIILKLIELYCYVSNIYDIRLAYSVQRFSNNCSHEFTDQDIITIYLWANLLTVRELKHQGHVVITVFHNPKQYNLIHGSGLIPIKRVLTELGFENLNVVKEQEKNLWKISNIIISKSRR